MQFKHFLLATLAFCFFVQTINAQVEKGSQEQDITVFESVLATAEWANFKYQDQLLAAKMGDYKATLKLLEFSGTVDGVAELEHSVTLLELLASGSDATFGIAVKIAKPKLKSVLLQRLQLAQGRTKNENLREPMEKWAPITWAALNGKVFVPTAAPGTESSMKSTDPKAKSSSTTKKTALDSPDAPVVEPDQSTIMSPASTKPKGKQ